MPSATMAIASRHRACCSLLPMNPGTSRRTSTGSLAETAEQGHHPAGQVAAVSWPGITSTTGIKSGGFHQWVPRTSSRRNAQAAISVTSSTEVLVASTASGAAADTAAKTTP